MWTLLTVLAAVGGCGSDQSAPPPAPVAFAVLTDVQYADKDTAGARYYRTALTKLEEAVAECNDKKPAFVIHLGDLIDGNAEKTAADLDTVLAVFHKLSVPAYFVVGNHCLMAGADALHQKLALEKFYYEFTVAAAPGWRFVVLDGNDAGYGVISDAQLQWLRTVLEKAGKKDEKVLCFCHYALIKEAAPHHRMASAEPVLAILDENPCVVAWMAGHDHSGGYAQRHGVHHVTLKGMVENPQNNAYAFFDIHDDCLTELGRGAESNRLLKFSSVNHD